MKFSGDIYIYNISGVSLNIKGAVVVVTVC